MSDIDVTCSILNSKKSSILASISFSNLETLQTITHFKRDKRYINSTETMSQLTKGVSVQ